MWKAPWRHSCNVFFFKWPTEQETGSLIVTCVLWEMNNSYDKCIKNINKDKWSGSLSWQDIPFWKSILAFFFKPRNPARALRGNEIILGNRITVHRIIIMYVYNTCMYVHSVCSCNLSRQAGSSVNTMNVCTPTYCCKFNFCIDCKLVFNLLWFQVQYIVKQRCNIMMKLVFILLN